MSPILTGVIASGRTVSSGGGASYESIATVTLNSDSTSVSFSSISTIYQHLQLRYLANDVTSSGENYYIVVNGDTAYQSYTYHRLLGNGSAVSTSGYGNDQSWLRGAPIGNSPTSSTTTFIGGIADILDSNNANKNKTVRSVAGVDFNANNTTGQMAMYSGLYSGSTNAVTSISIRTDAGTAFRANSKFALYGIKAA